MARPLRIECEGVCYHVTARGNERKRIFRSKSDFERFKLYILEAKEEFGWDQLFRRIADVLQTFRRFRVRLSEQSAIQGELDSIPSAMSQVKG